MMIYYNSIISKLCSEKLRFGFIVLSKVGTENGATGLNLMWPHSIGAAAYRQRTPSAPYIISSFRQ